MRFAAGALAVLSAVAFFVLLFAAGAGAAPPQNVAVDQIRQRVITLAPHITELIFAAGAGNRIVATVDSSAYPSAARSIPRIGNGVNVSLEKVIASRPDLVVAWMPSNATRMMMSTLKGMDVPLIYSNPRKLADIPAEIVKFGDLFGTAQAAGRTAAALSRRLRIMQEEYGDRRPVSVFIEVGAPPLYTIGRDAVLNDALRICGGVNIYADLAGAAPQVSAESVLMTQPDVVIASTSDKASLAQRLSFWSGLRLRAALKGHVYSINPDELFRPGPRLIDATQELCRILDQVRQAP